MTAARRTTLNDLAVDLGLSANTVSRALTGKDGVSQRTRDRVLRAAEESGYVAPDVSRTSSSRSIAVVVTSATNVFISALIAAVESASRAVDHSIVLHITEESPDQEAAVAAALLDQDVAGAIVIPVQGGTEPWGAVAERMPVVAVSREIPGIETDFVGTDARGALYAAARHVLSSGARNLLLFDEDLGVSTIRDRATGFDEAVADVPGATGRVIEIPTRHFESNVLPWQPDEGYRHALDVIDAGIEFDAVLVADDYYALGVMRALKERGRRIPDDVLVMGYGNHPYAGYLTPSLSSIAIPVRLIGEVAVSTLMQRLTGDTTPHRHRLLKPELMIRESSLGANRHLA